MRVGMTMYFQNYQDWGRYEAAERGEDVPPLDPSTDNVRYQEELETALAAEAQGWDSLWTVEHHVSPYTMTANPLQFLSFIAGATSRIDVGTMVVVLPWHHPLRVAEDITALQYQLCGRTPYIGFGRGAARREFRQLGLDMNQSRERFDESIQIVKLALQQERFSFHGKHYDFEDVTMRPRPLDPDALIENFHFSWGSPSSAPIGARFGLKPLIIPQRAWADYHVDLETFARAREEAGYAVPARPRIHMNVYCAPTEAAAREGAERYIAEYADSARRNYELDSGHFATTKGYEHYADQAAGLVNTGDPAQAMAATYLANHVWGTPEQCIEKMRGIADAFHPEEFMLVMRYGTMPREVAAESIGLFSREVLPAVQAIPVEEPITYRTPVAG